MDKKTILAFILIGAILVVTQTNWYKRWVLGIKNVKPVSSIQDSSKVFYELEDTLQTVENSNVKKKNNKPIIPLIKSDDVSSGEDIIVNTDNYRAILSTKGATIKSWQLKKYFYDKDKGIPVQLIKDEGYGNLGILFSVGEDTVFTYNYIFQTDRHKINLTEKKQTASIIFELNLNGNKKLRKTFTFYKDKYSLDLNVELINLGSVISDRKYSLVWLSGLNQTEINFHEDLRNTKAYIFTGGDKEELKLPDRPNKKKQTPDIEGKIDWVAIRTKYFASIIFPKTEEDITARLQGETLPLDKKNIIKNYKTYLQFKIPESKKDSYAKSLQVYLGPLDYSIIKHYHSGFDKIMGYGPAIIRPFAKLTIKVFNFLHSFIPNYGLVLIIFSILVKVVVYPLTRKSYVSMREMQKLQPSMNELKEKYGSEPQRLNKEMMKLYKEHGVNPLSGCLPTLLQMPLLWSIFLVFRNTIQLRQAPFVLWIKDLSSPDTILLPFSFPLFGNALHIIPLVMGATMFLQQKITMKDPKQKAMVYFMPIFLTFIFYNFPSGLNLYYTLFNIFSVIQQRIISEKPGKEENLQKAEPIKKIKNKNPSKKK